jgi:glutamine amidotransferase
MRVVVIDYGSGNLQSVMQSLQTAADTAGLNYDFLLIDSAKDIVDADRVVLPGVGSFTDCAKGLRSIDGMEAKLNDAVLNRGIPFLGICVGMQLMADRGLEDGDTAGLGWIAGTVDKIEAGELKIPHMGWNGIDLNGQHPVFKGIQQGNAVYFVHSYQFECTEKDDILASTEYGDSVVAAIGKDNMIGMQFHPEKSQNIGQIMLMNWLNWKP